MGSNFFTKLGMTTCKSPTFRSRPRWSDLVFLSREKIQTWLEELDRMTMEEDVHGLLLSVFDEVIARDVLSFNQKQ